MELVRIANRPEPRLPKWLRKSATNFQALHVLKVELRERKLHTVCESARCPNIHECFARKAATFMILGNTCTRTCGFCAVPQGRGESLNLDEPRQIAEMAARMELRYVVITSVNRDDLPDGGSAQFAQTVRAVRSALPEAQIEVLTPDFCGDLNAVARVLDAEPDVFNHNMETVARLYRRVRPQADYTQSLEVLQFAKQYSRRSLTKSGLMVGLGESGREVQRLLDDLRGAQTDVATIGQYLQPKRNRLPVEEFVHPDTFERYREYGESIGFRTVFSGPLVRSSYMADVVEKQAATSA